MFTAVNRETHSSFDYKQEAQVTASTEVLLWAVRAEIRECEVKRTGVARVLVCFLQAGKYSAKLGTYHTKLTLTSALNPA